MDQKKDRNSEGTNKNEITRIDQPEDEIIPDIEYFREQRRKGRRIITITQRLKDK